MRVATPQVGGEWRAVAIDEESHLTGAFLRGNIRHILSCPIAMKSNPQFQPED